MALKQVLLVSMFSWFGGRQKGVNPMEEQGG